MRITAPEERVPQQATGLAHVATASFLASRLVPSGGFWVALAGGVALARAAERLGARAGFGASTAAMLQTVAIMGPVRFGVPLTQALTAPLMGRMEARGYGARPQFAVCALLRLLSNALIAAFFILFIVGGPEAYAGPLDWLAERVGVVPSGPEGALILTGLGLLGWAVFASAVQVWVYRRGLSRWVGETPLQTGDDAVVPPADPPSRWDPRALALAALVAWVVLLARAEWVALAALAAWLLAVTAFTRLERDVAVVGAVIAAVLAVGVAVFTLAGGFGIDLALRRGARAGMLVLVATWLRCAAGEPGLRELAQRTLGRLRRVPSAPEAAAVLERLGHGRELGPAARSLADEVRPAPKEMVPFVDAVLAWVRGEAARFRPHEPGPRPPFRFRVRDALVLAGVAAAAAAALAI